jgi:hypothetical protein
VGLVDCVHDFSHTGSGMHFLITKREERVGDSFMGPPASAVAR